jgi:hypothetical protein
VICETRSQTKHITNAIHFVLHQYWVKLDYRKVKLLAIDFTEEVTLQPFNITTLGIQSQKQMVMRFAENFGV